MKLIVTALVLGIASISVAGTADPWVHVPPKILQLTYAMPELERTQFSEVPISLAPDAFAMLEKIPIVELQDNQSQKVGRNCETPKHAYLVRAVFEHGGNGTFHVKQLRESPWVLHYALGQKSLRHRSALVVCTDTPPTTIYVSAGGAT